MSFRSTALSLLVFAGLAGCGVSGFAQQMPGTAGETLSGKHVKPADAVHGRESVLIAGFSHDGGMRCGAWMKAVEGDSALKDVEVLELAMLEKAPGLFRGMIKSGMRKGMPQAEQDRIVVMTQDQSLWEKYFRVGDDSAPYVLVLNAKGDVVWHGYGGAELEPELKKALGK